MPLQEEALPMAEEGVGWAEPETGVETRAPREARAMDAGVRRAEEGVDLFALGIAETARPLTLTPHTDEVAPGVVFAEGEHLGVGAFALEGGAEAVVGGDEIEAAARQLARAVGGVLAVVVYAVADDDVAAVEIVLARSVVVGVEAARGVVGIAAMEFGAYGVVAVERPIDAVVAGIAAGEASRQLLRTVVEPGAALLPVDEARGHGVVVGFGAEGFPHTLEAVGGEPVVGVDHRGESARGVGESEVARHGLSAVGGRAEEAHAWVALSIAPHHVGAPIGAAVVDADDLQALLGLAKQRVEALGQPGLRIIDGYEDGEAHFLINN